MPTNLLELGERVAGVEDVVAEEVRHRAAIGVGAGLGLRADDAGGGAELGVVVGGRDLRLGDRLERRVDDDQPEQRIVIVGAVEQVRRPGEALAVDDLAVGPLRILARCRLRRRRLHPRRQQLEGREAPVQDRQARHCLFRERGRHVAALGLQQGSAGAHLDRLAQLAELQLDVQARLLAWRLRPPERTHDNADCFDTPHTCPAGVGTMRHRYTPAQAGSNP